MTIKQASEHLAEVAVIGRRLREKTAAGGLMESIQPYLDQAKGYASQVGDGLNTAVKNVANPQDNTWEAIRNGLIGAGVGAGAGGLASLAQPKGRRRSLSTMLQGALLGAGIGGGGTLAMQQANLAGKLPDSAVQSRIAELQATLKRNIARATPEANTAVQAEIDSLQQRLQAMPKPAGPAAPPPPTSSALQRLDSAVTDLNQGSLPLSAASAANTMFPNPGTAIRDAGIGGVGGYVAGAGLDHGVAGARNYASRGARLDDMGLDEITKAVGSAPTVAGSAAGTPGARPMAQTILDDIKAAPSRPVLGKSVPASAKPHLNSLLKKSPTQPLVPGRGLRRLGGIAGAAIGSQWNQRPRE